MTPAEALEMKLTAVNSIDRIRGNRRARELVVREQGSNFIDDEYGLLLKSIPVFWKAEQSGAVNAAAQSYPLDGIPQPPGLDFRPRFYCFERPFLEVIVPPTPYWPNAPASIRLDALLWSTVIFAHGTKDPKSPPGTLGFQVIGYLRHPDRYDVVSNVFQCFSVDGHRWVPDSSNWVRKDKSYKDECVRVLRFILTSNAFLDQRIMSSEPVGIERHARKRAARLNVDPMVHVVMFRKMEQKSTTQAEPTDWSCRWIVRGHWRNQFHSASKRHVPTWINPHIKGPETLPLKTPAPEVWAVTR